MPGDTVVIAVDGSEFSDYALRFYADILHNPENKVIIVHSAEFRFVSYPAVSIMTGDTDMSTVTREIQAEEDKSAALEEKIKEELGKMKILDVEVLRLHGDAGQAVVQLANERGADFIVVGSRGKSSIRRTFTGSVTDFIVHHSPVPVMVAKDKDIILKHHHHHQQHHHGFHMNPFHTNHHRHETSGK